MNRDKSATPPTEKLYTEAEVKAQCVEARADEFLWVLRKLREYKYNREVFEGNFVAQHEEKYRALFQQQDTSQEGTE